MDNISAELLSCPITHEIFTHPTVLNCGHTFEKSAINAHFDIKHTCPICNCVITSAAVNWALAAILGLTIKNPADMSISVDSARNVYADKVQKEVAEWVMKIDKKILSRSAKMKNYIVIGAPSHSVVRQQLIEHYVSKKFRVRVNGSADAVIYW